MSNHVTIIVRNSDNEESFSKALAIFTKKVNKNGHLKLIKERNRGYLKPSQIKHQHDLDILHKRKIDKRKGQKRRKY